MAARVCLVAGHECGYQILARQPWLSNRSGQFPIVRGDTGRFASSRAGTGRVTGALFPGVARFIEVPSSQCWLRMAAHDDKRCGYEPKGCVLEDLNNAVRPSMASSNNVICKGKLL